MTKDVDTKVVIALIHNQSSTKDIIHYIFRHGSNESKREILIYTKDVECVTLGLKDDDANVQISAVLSQVITPQQLDYASHSKYSSVRECVAKHSQTSTETLLFLAQDVDEDVAVG